MWLLAKSPESKYILSVFYVIYFKLLWLPPASHFCLSIENILAVPGAEERSVDVAWILNWYLPDLPSPIQRESSGPLAIR